MAVDGLASSPAPLRDGATLEEELTYYKAQYEQLEVELQDFQASSKDLEAELEKDIDASEKRERGLREKVESLGFEVGEWKVSLVSCAATTRGQEPVLDNVLTLLADQVQGLQDGGCVSAECAAKGNHDAARRQPDAQP